MICCIIDMYGGINNNEKLRLFLYQAKDVIWIQSHQRYLPINILDWQGNGILRTVAVGPRFTFTVITLPLWRWAPGLPSL